MSLDVVLGHGWLIAFLALWIGLSVGSFLNVVIYRLPIMLERNWRRQSAEHLGVPAPADGHPERFDLAVPRSRCSHCGTARWPSRSPTVLK